MVSVNRQSKAYESGFGKNRSQAEVAIASNLQFNAQVNAFKTNRNFQIANLLANSGLSELVDVGVYALSTIGNNSTPVTASVEPPEKDPNDKEYKETRAKLIKTVLETIKQDKNSELAAILETKYDSNKSVYKNISDEDLSTKLAKYAQAWLADTKTKPSEESIAKIRDIIGNNTKLADCDLEKIAKRYELLKAENKTEADIQKEVLALATNILGANKFDELSLNPEGEAITLKDVENALKIENDAEAMTAFKTAYLNYADRHIDTVDTNNDDFIQYYEFEKEEISKAQKVELEIDQEVYNKTLDQFKKLDQNNDGKLDREEIASWIWGLSKYNDGENNCNGKSAYNITASEIVSMGNDQFENNKKYTDTLAEGYKNFKSN